MQTIVEALSAIPTPTPTLPRPTGEGGLVEG